MTATEQQSTTELPLSPWDGPEADTRTHPRRVKAPFLLTRMDPDGRRPVLWLWSRRGDQWVVEQEVWFGQGCLG